MEINNRAQEMFPKRLQRLMNTTNTTQQKLADYIGIKRQSVAQYADGSILPTIEKLDKIADYFNVSSDYLLGRTDIESPEIDIIAINKLTGLSDKAIKSLEFIRNGENTDILNKILDTTQWRTILFWIKHLLHLTRHDAILKQLDVKLGIEELDAHLDRKRKLDLLQDAISSITIEQSHSFMQAISVEDYAKFVKYQVSEYFNNLLNDMTVEVKENAQKARE